MESNRSPVLTDEDKSRGLAAVETTVTVEMTGPLPAPHVLAQYDAIYPGAAEKIINMAEKQMEHRHYLEKTVVESGVRDRPHARNGAIVLSGLFLAASCYLAKIGYPAYGISIAGSELVALVSIYIYGHFSQRKELDHKNEIKTRNSHDIQP